MAIREGLWDCSHCSTKGIKGRHKVCPNCNDPRNQSRDPEEAPYLPSDAEEVTNAELLDLANAGPDWNCRYCSRSNRGDKEICESCGHSADTNDVVNEAKTYENREQVPTYRLAPRSSDDEEPVETVLDGTYGDQPRNFWQIQKTKLIAGGLVVVLIIAGFVVYSHFFSTHTVNLQVANLKWDRQVEVEVYKTLTEQDWDIPLSGREIRSFSDVHHYNHVLDHYTTESYQESEQVSAGSHTEQYVCGSRTVDKGNGFFETKTEYCTRTVQDYRTEYHTKYRQVPVYRDDPVYRTKYEYQIERWITDHWEKASGDSGEFSDKLRWPEPQNLASNQRQGDGRTEQYIVTLAGEEGKTYSQEPGFAIWSRLNKGQVITGEVNQTDDLRSINWP